MAHAVIKILIVIAHLRNLGALKPTFDSDSTSECETEIVDLSKEKS